MAEESVPREVDAEKEINLNWGVRDESGSFCKYFFRDVKREMCKTKKKKRNWWNANPEENIK